MAKFDTSAITASANPMDHVPGPGPLLFYQADDGSPTRPGVRVTKGTGALWISFF